jgi:hypothetical protein
MNHEDGSLQIARQVSHQPNQCLDPSGGESDNDDITTGHAVFPGTKTNDWAESKWQHRAWRPRGSERFAKPLAEVTTNNRVRAKAM